MPSCAWRSMAGWSWPCCCRQRRRRQRGVAAEQLPSMTMATIMAEMMAVIVVMVVTTTTTTAKVVRTITTALTPADHRSTAERRFGLRSFVYTSHRPFSRYLFTMELERWAKTCQGMGKPLALREKELKTAAAVMAEPKKDEGKLQHRPIGAGSAGQMSGGGRTASGGSLFAPVLRSKGLLWLDTSPELALNWNHAGRDFRYSVWGKWGAQHLGEEQKDKWLESPRSELVFIGAAVDEEAVRGALDACVVSEDNATAS